MKMMEKLLQELQTLDLNQFNELLQEVSNQLEKERLLKKLDGLFVNEDLVYCTSSSIERCIIIGDIHGDLDTLLEIAERIDIEKIKEQKAVVVFLGDYGDRGKKSPEVYYLLFKLKTILKEKIVLLRGNHEGPDDLLAQPHDLPLFFIERYGQEGYTFYLRIKKLFEKFYLAFVVLNKLIALHGGIPSNALSLDDIAIARKIHPKKRLLEEILWNDPMDEYGIRESYRGAGKLFGPDITENFLKRNNLLVVIRGHEPARFGYFLSHNGKVVTVFSRKGAPYFNEKAAYLDINLNKLDSHEDISKFIINI
jgi:protein phosphatase